MIQIVAAVIVLTLVAACSKHDDSNLVAAAIGPLAAPPYRGDFKPDPRAEPCRYETKNHRRMLVSVDWNGGKAAMKMIGFGRKLTDQLAKQGEEKMGVTVLSTGDTTTPPADTSEYPSGPWEEAGPSTSMGYEAVKGPLLIKASALGDRKTVLALLGRAVTSMP